MPFSRPLLHIHIGMALAPAALVSFVLSISMFPGNAHQATAQPETAARYSRKQLRSLLRGARTAEDHERLAAYYRIKARGYSAQEVRERRALADYLEHAANYSSKYPTRGDSVRGMAAHYHLQAVKAAAAATEHERIADALRGGK